MSDVRVTGGQTNESAQGAPPPGTPVQVTVFAEGRPGAVTFSHEWRFEGGHYRGDGRIEIPAMKKNDPGTTIRFQLVNRTHPRVHLRFVDDPANAIWVARDECPERTPSSDDEIICIAPSGESLTVLDRNQEDCLLHYNLRFEPDPNQYCYDPEIKNGGGTVPLNE